jgi:hypothetical protein
MKINIEITNEKITDQFITAIEVGSNYWYYLKDLSMLSEKTNCLPLSERIAHAILHEKEIIPVHDIENGELLGNLTKENTKKALQIMSKDYTEAFSDIINETGDAETADIFFQLAVMGEVVFG